VARAARAVLAVNIVQGDALTMTTAPSGEPITFPEWGYLGKGKFQRRDFRFDTSLSAPRSSKPTPCSAMLDDEDLFSPRRRTRR
jgi:hypothetical protein